MPQKPALLDPLRGPKRANEYHSESFTVGAFDPFGPKVTAPQPRSGQRGFSHDEFGTCPVCRQPLVEAYLPDGEAVGFCPVHRFSLPQPV